MKEQQTKVTLEQRLFVEALVDDYNGFKAACESATLANWFEFHELTLPRGHAEVLRIAARVKAAG